MTILPSPTVNIQQFSGFRNPVSGVLMLTQSKPLLIKKAPSFQIRSSIKDQVFVFFFCKVEKVFEDNSKGIICYKDDRGAIICEGLDEGPRLHQQFHLTPYYLRNAEINELLQQRWLRNVEGAFSNGGPMLEETNCNGPNALH